MSAIRHIRTRIFEATQSEFAALVGVKQSSVSRWENGVAPSLDDMAAIRDAAKARGIDWRDDWFFMAADELDTAARDAVEQTQPERLAS